MIKINWPNIKLGLNEDQGSVSYVCEWGGQSRNVAQVPALALHEEYVESPMVYKNKLLVFLFVPPNSHDK